MKIIVVNNKRQLSQFIKLPFRMYKNDANWVAPLLSEQKKFFNPDKNPYFQHSEVQLFLAEKDGKIVGRISAQTNTQHNKTHNDNVGFFGFFECANDVQIAKALLKEAVKWLSERECNTMRGPMNLSVNDECGLLIDGFDIPPFVMMTHNHPYYQKLLEEFGLKKSMDLLAYLVPVSKPPEKIKKLSELLMKRGKFTVRCLSSNKKQLRKDIETVFTVYTKAWERNWGFVPMTKAEFDHLVDELLPIVKPEFVYIAEVDGVPAGFSVTLPDYNFILKKMKGRILPTGIFKALYYKNKINRLRVITLGVIKEYQSRGIDTVFYNKSFETAYEHKTEYTEAEFSWILENNVMMNRIALKLGGKVHKRYRIFDIPI
jgi:GNAT superfamily N-acetyltransferase